MPRILMLKACRIKVLPGGKLTSETAGTYVIRRIPVLGKPRGAMLIPEKPRSAAPLKPGAFRGAHARSGNHASQPCI